MLRVLWWLIVGFDPRTWSCKHTWEKWHVENRFVNDKAGVVLVIQDRCCSKCGLTQTQSHTVS